MLSLDIILIFFVVVFLLLALYREWFRPAVSFFVAILVLTVAGILSPREVLSGFANEQLAIIILLLIFSDIVRQTSVIDWLFDKIFGGASSSKGLLGRMLLYIPVTSAFFNNTPLVAMMTPYVYNWSKRTGISPSKLLIPLSFTAILGGCITLVGTSTNLIVNGLTVEADLPPLEIFDFFYAGLPALVAGGLYLILFSHRILPDRKDLTRDFVESSREYFVETRVNPESSLIGKTVKEANLRNLEGLFLVEVIREGKSISPISPEEVLLENDKLIFTGDTAAVGELTSTANGLSLPKGSKLPEHDVAGLAEVVISYNSSLIGNKIKESDFRGKYDGVIIAVHRNGEKISGKIGDVELYPGDVLLIMAGPDFYKRVKNNQAFYLISNQEKPRKVNVYKAGIIVAGIIASIIVSALHILPLFTALLILLGIVFAMQVIPLSDIRKGMDFNLIVLLALGLALGKAMINSGAANLLAESLLNLAGPIGPFFLLMAIFLLTNIMAAYITNKAAVAIFFPVSVTIAQSMNLELAPFILIVAYGAAANFITPIGYQTNLMVYGPGGYSFKDFFKIGLPLTIIYMIISSGILAWKYDMW